ncbi:MAG: deoxyguanosinetriphosphate triphosphohydrolase [Oscillospiraceae bacterium]|nr:deoxyguanosinetriphosphate triphosphohydrolase [Oscillospiraceae bacterium]
MNIREELEQNEYTQLAPWAAKAAESRGRLLPEEENDVRTCYQRDVDRIVYSKSFRRLKHKTQVFLQPEGDHYRTRLTHTLEVVRISRTIARALRLNEDLTEAVAFGHDLGHTPFGHAGEKALTDITGRPFRHNEQSLRVVDVLEKNGEGLNLSYETRMGIVGHTGDFIPETLEGQIIRIADRIAYINHDIDDACRAGILTNQDIPRDIRMILGETHSERINTLVMDLIEHSRGKDHLERSPEIAETMERLRDFMFERVYRNPVAKGEESKARDIIGMLYEYYVKHPEKIPADFQTQLDFDGIERTACDYIAGMTDKYAVYKFSEIFIPTAWNVRG